MIMDFVEIDMVASCKVELEPKRQITQHMWAIASLRAFFTHCWPMGPSS